MKTKAAILFLCFSAFVLDTMSIAYHFKVKEIKTTCCRKMIAKHGNQKTCPEKSRDCTKDCFNCPLTYTATITPGTYLAPAASLFEVSFILYKVTFNSRFKAKAWKPPRNV